jgi:hypothetical protein
MSGGIAITTQNIIIIFETGAPKHYFWNFCFGEIRPVLSYSPVLVSYANIVVLSKALSSIRSHTPHTAYWCLAYSYYSDLIYICIFLQKYEQ